MREQTKIDREGGLAMRKSPTSQFSLGISRVGSLSPETKAFTTTPAHSKHQVTYLYYYTLLLKVVTATE